MGSLGVDHSFSASPQIHKFHGILLDFDGTIVDSTEAIVSHWKHLSRTLGVDPNTILATSHGRRSIDVLKLYDESKANWEFVREIEGRIPQEYGANAVEIPGARQLLRTLEENRARWAVVTSGTRPLISGWLQVMALTQPKHLITAEEVQNGKPDPEGYLMGKQRLGLAPDAAVLVVEDAPSGIRAGRAAGCKVLGLSTTHGVEQVAEAGADWIVQDLRSVKILDCADGTITLEISNSLLATQ